MDENYQVDINIRGNLYTSFRSNQEQLRKMQLDFIGPWQESNLRPCDSGAAL